MFSGLLPWKRLRLLICRIGDSVRARRRPAHARMNSVVQKRMPRRMQQTLILLKPDCVQRRLVGAIIGRLEQKGLRLAAMKLVQASRSLAEKHYAVHKGKPFYDSLV